MPRPTTRTRSPISEALIALRHTLGEGQQQFANRVKSAVTSIARYETSNPPTGKALARFTRIANEAGRPDLAAIFDTALAEELRALAARLGQPENSPESEQRAWLHALDEIRLEDQPKFASIIETIAKTISALKKCASDPIRFNRLERLQVLLRASVANPAERWLESEATKMAAREGITYVKACGRLLDANPERYTQYLEQKEGAMRGIQFARRKKKGSK
jgi:transcriptional regulator with XRE-family HTH domain